MSNRTRFLFLAVVACWVGLHSTGLSASPPPPLCDEVCSSETTCTDECYVDLMEFENGNSISCYEYGVYALPCCGDSRCDLGSETEMGSCDEDCGSVCTPPNCPDCNPISQTGCSTGEMCNRDGECVPVPFCDGSGCDDPPVPPECYEDFCNYDWDCCSGNFCAGNVGGFSMGVCSHTR